MVTEPRQLWVDFTVTLAQTLVGMAPPQLIDSERAEAPMRQCKSCTLCVEKEPFEKKL